MLNPDFLELKNRVLFLETIKQEMIEVVDGKEKQALSDFYLQKSFEMNDFIRRILKREKETQIYKEN